ncbi:hypothetical protein LTR36_003919 [Oleoguttula mirabilis]|uniref:Uncharacterized protein n=1 Tax=Oleoguttula mirabilis TaxID=1507867 RepID=A0AAV9JI83_9PEZI|nr:hypothetical protein LTR36_003919 [Oleoguttula mirabilis]
MSPLAKWTTLSTPKHKRKPNSAGFSTECRRKKIMEGDDESPEKVGFLLRYGTKQSTHWTTERATGGVQAPISPPAAPVLALSNIREKLTEAWHAYLDLGIKFYSIPIEVIDREDYIGDDTYDLLTVSYHINAMPLGATATSVFESIHNNLRLAQERSNGLAPKDTLEPEGQKLPNWRRIARRSARA